MTKRRAKRVLLSQKDALARIQKMYPLVKANVVRASLAKASLESANDIVGAKYFGIQFHGANTYNVTRMALTSYMALVVSRLYDGYRSHHEIRQNGRRHPNKSDIASIPLFVRLLKRKGCQAVLVDDARRRYSGDVEWANQSGDRIAKSLGLAVAAFAQFESTASGRAAIKTLSRFRNTELAHTLLLDDKPEVAPVFVELYTLIDVAAEVVEHSSLALEGKVLFLKEAIAERTREARSFWEPALDAAIAANLNRR